MIKKKPHLVESKKQKTSGSEGFSSVPCHRVSSLLYAGQGNVPFGGRFWHKYLAHQNSLVFGGCGISPGGFGQRSWAGA